MDDNSPDWAFQNAVATVLQHEGGFVNDPDDPGGATNYGVSLRFLLSQGELDRDQDGWLDFDFDRDGDIDGFDVSAMTQEQAIMIYRDFWWDKYHYDTLPGMVAMKVFDFSVNMGPGQAHILLQRALRANGCRDIEDDGVIGPITRRAVVSGDALSILAALRSEAAGFYRRLAATNPVRKKYLKGWLTRAYS